MSTRAVSWALEQEGLQPTIKIVLIAMADSAGDTGKSFSANKTLLRITGHIKEDTISAAQQKLRDMKLIADTGKRTGSTGRVKVFQMHPRACKVQPEPEDAVLFESPANPPSNGVLNPPRIPRESPANPPFDGERLITRERGTGNGEGKPPSLESVKAYAVELKAQPVEANKFFDHFTSNGWKVGGKSPMKDWKAAFRNWSRNVGEFSRNKPRFGDKPVPMAKGWGGKVSAGGVNIETGERMFMP